MFSYRHLNQIFYKNNKFDNPNDLISLEKHFYTAADNKLLIELPVIKEEPKEIIVPVSAIQIILPEIVEPKQQVEPKQSVEPPQRQPVEPRQSNLISNYFKPSPNDTLFWCIFYATQGAGEYSQIGSRYGNREILEKEQIVKKYGDRGTSLMQTNYKIFKQTNFKITNAQAQEILAEFMVNSGNTTLLGLIGLVVHHNLRIYILDTTKKVYLKFFADNSEEDIIVLERTGSNKKYTKYQLRLNTIPNDIKEIEENMLCLEHFLKPLKAVSNYTIVELKDLADKMGLKFPEDKKMKKNEIYEKLTEHCQWI